MAIFLSKGLKSVMMEITFNLMDALTVNLNAILIALLALVVSATNAKMVGI